MENKQRKEKQEGSFQKEELASDAPGQVLPAKDRRDELNTKQGSGTMKEHSESSMPEKENETLGTP